MKERKTESQGKDEEVGGGGWGQGVEKKRKDGKRGERRREKQGKM